MYPEYARDTATRYVKVARADDFTIDPEAAVAAIEAGRPDVVVIASPNNPTGTAVGLDTIKRVCDVPRPAWSSLTRRMPSSGGRAHPRR